MNEVGGEDGWDVHPVVRVPLHDSQCRICREYRNHAININKENGSRMAVDMAKAWGRQGCGELRVEITKLREERDEARAEIDELKKRLEQFEKSADTRKEESPGRSSPESPMSGEEENREAWPGPTEPPLVLNTSNEGPGIISPSSPIPTRRVGRGDIVGFGPNGVYILRNRDFAHPEAAKLEVPGFGLNDGWVVGRHVRLVGDTTGNGRADIIGLGPDGVSVSRNNGASFSPPSRVLRAFGTSEGWDPDHLQYAADLRGKGYIDILGFGGEGVCAALNDGNGYFGHPLRVLNEYGDRDYSGDWRSVNAYPRFLADVNGDGILDIVAFGDEGMFVNIGKGDGSFSPRRTVLGKRFGFDRDGWTGKRYSRTIADLTGDGKPDIVGFATGGVLVALNNGDGTFQSPKVGLDYFGTVVASSKVWVDRHFIADVNGSGFGDVVAFSNAGVWVAIGNGDGTFQPPRFVTKDFSEVGGWRGDEHPRFVVDLTGNGAGDIIGFGGDAVWVSYNDGRGNFGPIQKLTAEFSVDSGWNVKNTVRWMANLGST